MAYLIYEDDELIDVMEFSSEEILNDYKSMNPTHRLEPEEELEVQFLALEELNEDEYFDEKDEIPLW